MADRSPMTLDGLRKRSHRATNVPKGELVTKTARRAKTICVRCGSQLCNLKQVGVDEQGWGVWVLRCTKCHKVQADEMTWKELQK